MVLVIRDHQLHPVDISERLVVLAEDVEVRASHGPTEYSNGAGIPCRIVAGILERFARGFQEQSMLWISERSVARGESEELGVEEIDAVEYGRSIDVSRQARDLIRNP